MRIAWVVFIAVTLLAYLSCTPRADVTVDLARPAIATSRPVVEVTRGDTTYDRWLPYAMAGMVFLAWIVPALWPFRRGRSPPAEPVQPGG
jgi:hypothetical protein